jgi:carbonic anhydrase/acetyltransferase-like protein (isoleucine patch superfamily)
MVAMSGRSPPGFAGFLAALRGASIAVGFGAPLVAMGSIVGRFATVDRGCVVVEHAPAELHDAFHHFIGALAYAKNLTACQRDHGVRRDIDVLDQI